MQHRRRSGTKRALAFLWVVCAGSVVSLPSQAQIAGLMGSTSGSYCKIKKNDTIRVNTMLPLDRSESFTRQMTLRRLASLARSRGFSAILVSDKGCGTMLINNSPRFRSCKLEARMVDSASTPPTAKHPPEWFAVEQILADTQAEAPLYPRTTGLLNKGNKCVID